MSAHPPDPAAARLPEPVLPDLGRTALVVIDVQRGFDNGSWWGRRDNGACEDGIDGAHDLLVVKDVNSAFHGHPDLHAWLLDRDLEGIVVAGITTNHCCETTARVGANLGHQVLFALDATHTFDRPAPDGTVVPAEQLAWTTATNLHGEFATVVTTAHLLAGPPA